MENRKKEAIFIAAQVYRESVFLSMLNPEDRIVMEMDDLARIVKSFKDFGAKIVLTMGTFDLLHVGHGRYIRKAREQGSLLIVGVDDDLKARGRKGENRPAVPFDERAELLTYLRWADLVVKKGSTDEKWQMIRIVRPYVLVCVKGTYTQEEKESLKEFCEELVELDRQAETSTSAKLRTIILDGADTFKEIMLRRLPDFVTSLYDEMKRER